jgi:hypothetical protein
MNTQAENIQILEDAIGLLYQTYITDKAVAEQRGIAITAMDKMVKMMGKDSVAEKIEATPYSARLRRRRWLAFIQHPMVAFVMGYLLGVLYVYH